MLIILSSTSSARRPSNETSSPSQEQISSAGSARGKSTVIVNSVPFPFSVWTLISPPIISTILFVIARPSPVPWILLTVEVRSRSKGTNRRSTNSRLIPMPVSLMRISYLPVPSLPGSSFICRDTLPFSSVNFPALHSRFITARSIMTLSHSTHLCEISQDRDNLIFFASSCTLTRSHTSRAQFSRFTQVGSRMNFPLSMRLISSTSFTISRS